MAQTKREKKTRRNMIEALIIFLACLVTFVLTTFVAGRSPEKAADSFLDAIVSFNPNKVSSYYAGEVSDFDFSTMILEAAATDAAESSEEAEAAERSEAEQEEDLKFSKLLFDFTYEVGDASKDGKTASVPVTIKTYPLGKTWASSEDPKKAILALEKEGRTETHETTFTLTRTNGEWQVDPLTDDNKNALSGGLFEVLHP